MNSFEERAFSVIQFWYVVDDSAPEGNAIFSTVFKERKTFNEMAFRYAVEGAAPEGNAVFSDALVEAARDSSLVKAMATVILKGRTIKPRLQEYCQQQLYQSHALNEEQVDAAVYLEMMRQLQEDHDDWQIVDGYPGSFDG